MSAGLYSFLIFLLDASFLTELSDTNNCRLYVLYIFSPYLCLIEFYPFRSL